MACSISTEDQVWKNRKQIVYLYASAGLPGASYCIDYMNCTVKMAVYRKGAVLEHVVLRVCHDYL